MNDNLLMANYLMILKSNIEVYVHGTIESSNKDVRDLLHEGLDETLLHQSKIYDLMTDYGYYEIENLDDKKIEETIEKLNQ